MAFLFKIENKKVFPNTETLLISPFKEIWERDKSNGKEVAISEFAYIEFMSSILKTNPYREYPEDRKDTLIRKEIIKNDKWKPDELIHQALNKIKLLQTEGSITYNYWMSNKLAIEKMIDFFNNFNLNERNEKTNNPIYKPKDITSAIIDAEKTLSTLNAIKSKVDEEVFSNVKVRKDKIISPFANPDSLNI